MERGVIIFEIICMRRDVKISVGGGAWSRYVVVLRPKTALLQ